MVERSSCKSCDNAIIRCDVVEVDITDNRADLEIVVRKVCSENDKEISEASVELTLEDIWCPICEDEDLHHVSSSVVRDSYDPATGEHEMTAMLGFECESCGHSFTEGKSFSVNDADFE